MFVVAGRFAATRPKGEGYRAAIVSSSITVSTPDRRIVLKSYASHTDCTFNEGTKKRGPPKGYVDDLERRCRGLERIIKRVGLSSFGFGILLSAA